MMTDLLRERVAEAVRGALKSQNGHVINDYSIYFGSSGTVDPEALSASLIASLGLKLEWVPASANSLPDGQPFYELSMICDTRDRAIRRAQWTYKDPSRYVPASRIVSDFCRDALQVEESGQ